MKSKEIIDSTTDSRIYKMAKRHFLNHTEGICSRCPPRRGCNSSRNRWKRKSWKYYRKTQYKSVDVSIKPIEKSLLELYQEGIISRLVMEYLNGSI